MRWLAVLVVSAVGVALAAAGLFLLRDDGPEELLPDLDQAVPSRARDRGGRRLLPAGLRVGGRQRRPRPAPDRGRAARSGDARHGGQPARPPHGRRRSRRASFPARSGTRRRRPTSTGTCSASRSTSFGPPATERWCGRARRPASASATATRHRRAREVEGKPERAVWTDECGRDQPGLLTVRQGISPGFGDDYDPGLEGQFVDVTNVPRRPLPARAPGEPGAGDRGGELREQRRLRAHPAAPVRGDPDRPRSRSLPGRRDLPARLRLRSR